MELVSAVITTHKREPEIVERALKSILAQTYPSIETIVVDDSPTDYSLREQVKIMVEGYSEKNVRYVRHEECKGACAARNTGLKHSNGIYIGYLDDDDEWKPNKIEKQIEGFENENIALVYCGNEVIDEKDGSITAFNTLFHRGDVYEKLFILGNFIGSTSYPLLRTDSLKKIGGFDELLQSAQDYDVWIRLAEQYEVNYVTDILVRYHIHSAEQITKNYAKRANGLARLNEKNAKYLQKNKKAGWICALRLAPNYSGNGELFNALKLWLKAVFKYPFNPKTSLGLLYEIFKNYNHKK